MISPAALTHIMRNFSTKQFFGEIPTHVFHYMSPREEMPVGVTNHAATARATLVVCSRYVHGLAAIYSRQKWSACRRGTWCSVWWVLFCLLLKPRVRKKPRVSFFEPVVLSRRNQRQN